MILFYMPWLPCLGYELVFELSPYTHAKLIYFSCKLRLYFVAISFIFLFGEVDDILPSVFEPNVLI